MISFRAIKLYLGIILGTVVLVTFLTAVGNDFVDWDDYAFVTTNYHIRSISTDSLRWMLTTFYQGAWHPLTWFSHALDRSLWGLNPAPHRLINIILHTLNVLLFCGLCMRLQDAWVERNPQRETISPESRFVAAWTAALLFGIHPLRVESVAWIAERKDVLSAFFYLTTIITYLGYAFGACAGEDRKWRYLLSVALYLPAVLSKPMTVTLPLVSYSHRLLSALQAQQIQPLDSYLGKRTLFRFGSFRGRHEHCREMGRGDTFRIYPGRAEDHERVPCNGVLRAKVRTAVSSDSTLSVR